MSVKRDPPGGPGPGPVDLACSVANGSCWRLRLAREEDVPHLRDLIPLSARALMARYYSTAQIEAALETVFGVDRQLIRDGTYWVAEKEQLILGCGGWSRRCSLYGSDLARVGPDPELLPRRDAARVRAFFVHPDWARRGIGRSIMATCERAIRVAGFRHVEIVATLAGESLYASFAYAVVEQFEVPLPGELRLPVLRMTKALENEVTD